MWNIQEKRIFLGNERFCAFCKMLRYFFGIHFWAIPFRMEEKWTFCKILMNSFRFVYVNKMIIILLLVVKTNHGSRTFSMFLFRVVETFWSELCSLQVENAKFPRPRWQSSRSQWNACLLILMITHYVFICLGSKFRNLIHVSTLSLTRKKHEFVAQTLLHLSFTFPSNQFQSLTFLTNFYTSNDIQLNVCTRFGNYFKNPLFFYWI